MSTAESRIAGYDAWYHSRSERTRAQLHAVWGKSAVRDPATGLTARVPLLQHLLDALSVADLIWEHFIATKVRDRVEAFTGGEGRAFWRWLAAAHDLGKASPVFQVQAPQHLPMLTTVGLPIPRSVTRRQSQGWRHDRAGAIFLREELEARWGQRATEWIWPIIGGHHGAFYALSAIVSGDQVRRSAEWSAQQGTGPWAEVRLHLLEAITIAAGFGSVEEVAPPDVPSRAEQLSLAGFVMMADWISSDESKFGPVDEPSLATAMQRAAQAWDMLKLRGGWRSLAAPPDQPFLKRFGWPARPFQETVAAVSQQAESPPLIVIEAPMGEGKTEAALVAAEVLAHRFVCDGVLIGMPTQATADPMLDRVDRWLDQLSPGSEIALLHGRAAFNRTWIDLQRRRDGQATSTDTSGTIVDEYNLPVDLDEFDGGRPSYGEVCCEETHDSGPGETDDVTSGLAVTEWLLGRHRGLLSPNVVGTIDHALFAAVRSRSAAIRFAGLTGKVVILDEVHAADEYMTPFLAELLRWLGGAAVPVVLLSATLAASQRERLLSAYADGARSRAVQDAAPPQPLPGYPAVTAVWLSESEVVRRTWTAQAARAPIAVGIDVVDVDDIGLRDRLAAVLDPEGGCVLVIRNTVARAQETASILRERFDDDVMLLHSRLTTRERAEVTDRLLAELGPGGTRPRRRIVVATQVAEQSFDVDADLLVTDLAPVDLLLQRIGRLHRHGRPDRPSAVREPQVLVTGAADHTGLRPSFEPGSERIYGRHRLLRALAAIGRSPFTIPTDIARLVERAYSDDPGLPAEWVEDEAQARSERESVEAQSAARAGQDVLSDPGRRAARTLAGLSGPVSGIRDVEQYVRVRSGESGEEVLLVVQDKGRYRTLGGTDLGVQGERIHDLDVRDVLGDVVRLPGFDHDLNKAAAALPTLAEWHDHPWLGRTHVVVLDPDGKGDLDSRSITYTPGIGLVVGGPR